MFFLYSEITPAFFFLHLFVKAKVNSGVAELSVQCQCCHVNWLKLVPVETVGSFSKKMKPKHERLYRNPPVKGENLVTFSFSTFCYISRMVWMRRNRQLVPHRRGKLHVSVPVRSAAGRRQKPASRCEAECHLCFCCARPHDWAGRGGKFLTVAYNQSTVYVHLLSPVVGTVPLRLSWPVGARVTACCTKPYHTCLFTQT